MIRALATALLVAAGAAAAQAPIPPVARVVDQTGTLGAEQKAALERMLQAFEERKGAQIAVLMVPSTAGEPIEQYALRVAEQWKLGRKKVDDGALLVVAKQDRALRIEVGYGLEGVLPDAVAKRIVSDVIAPRFREGDFFGGLSAGIDRMIRVVDGEPLPPPARSAPAARDGLGEALPVLFVLALVGGGVLRAMLGRLPGAALTGGLVGLVAWLLAGAVAAAVIAGAIAFVFALVSGGVSRGYGGLPGGFSRSGSGGFGSGGFGGGFRGGGGGFGGGGASGRW